MVEMVLPELQQELELEQGRSEHWSCFGYLTPATQRRYLGGMAFGAKVLQQHVQITKFEILVGVVQFRPTDGSHPSRGMASSRP